MLVASAGERALIQGGVLMHLAQVTEPDWCPLFDGDYKVATRTRETVMREVEAEGTPDILPLPAPGLGRVVRYQGKRFWQIGA